MLSPLKLAILYASAIALMKGISLFMLPFITHQLPPSEFGKLEIISTLAALGSLLVGLGLEDALYRFVGASKDEKTRKQCASQIFTLTFMICAILFPLAWYLPRTIEEILPFHLTSHQLSLVLTMLALEGCIAVPLGWLRMQNRGVTFFCVAVGRAVLHAILTFVFLNMGKGVDGILEAGLIAALLQCSILCLLQIKETGMSYSSKQTKKALIYSLPIMASGLMAFSMNGLDRWVLAETSTLEDVALFGLAAKFALGLVLLLQPFGMWWMPKRFDVLYGENGHKKATKTTCFGLCAGMLIAVILAIAAPLVILALFPASYSAASQYVVLLITAALFKEMAEFINLGSYAGETAYAQMGINALAAVFACFSLYWGGGYFGVSGVLFALVFSQGLRLVMFYLVSQHLYPLPYPIKKLLFSGLCCLFWLGIAHSPWSLIERFSLIVFAPASLLVLNQKLNLLPAFPFYSLRKEKA